MCGIVGYTGFRNTVSVLLNGLEKLEYRGYDSSGIAVAANQGLYLEKAEGKLGALRQRLNHAREMPSGAGIGHTRWATHGVPSDSNAHPHTDCKGLLAVVHNGIIENYQELRSWLAAQGHVFGSETDTEVLPHLFEHFYQGNLFEAVSLGLERVEGSYALAAVAAGEAGLIVAARCGSPLVIGLGEEENLLASDIPAILSYTRDTVILEDKDLAIITPGKVSVEHGGSSVQKKVFHVGWDATAVEKNGFPHYMLKEIHEQPLALRRTMENRVTVDGAFILPGLDLNRDYLCKLKNMAVVACGTAYHAGMIGRDLIEKWARLPVQVEVASEFRYRQPLVGSETLVVVVSQSGETADTLAAMREAKALGATTLAITNVVDSSIAREADNVLYTMAGPEIAVASTKAYTTQIEVLTILAAYLGRERGLLSKDREMELAVALRCLPDGMERLLIQEAKFRDLGQVLSDHKDAFFIGRGLDYAVALEGALKLKEISYLHAEAYAAGELKHGTLALIEKGVPVIALATQRELSDKMVSNIEEVRARGGWIIAITLEGETEVARVADETVFLPDVSPLVAPALAVIPCQLLAYYTAVALGRDVDQPRNLAKSVTVE